MTAQFAPSTLPVVVGVDGSDSARRALVWATGEARRRKVGLHLVTAFAWAAPHGRTGLSERYRTELMDRAGRQVLAEAVAAAKEVAPGLEMTSELVVGPPVAVLGEQARHAQLLVVGSRGLGGVTGLLLGSVAVALAAHASCPMVVVRGEDRPDAADLPVGIGVDGSPTSEAALAFAFEAAAVRGVGLVAVHTWADVEFRPGMAPLVDWSSIAEDEEVVLAERLAGWSTKYPDVPVRRVVQRDGAATALVELSRDAQLVVVGSRGRGQLSGLLLGSVSHGVLHRSHCPVAVVRPDTATG